MKKLRMTAEELNSLKPSFENPIEPVCDDDFYHQDAKKIRAISPVVNDVYCILDYEGEMKIAYKDNLIHYPSFKEEPKEEKWFTVVAKPKGGYRPISYKEFYKSKEEFMIFNSIKEESYEWIDLVEYKRNDK